MVGGVTFTKLMLNSTQVEVEVEVVSLLARVGGGGWVDGPKRN